MYIDQFDAANINAQAFLCPDAFSIKLTEIRMTTYQKPVGTYDSRFVEYYNDGANHLDLSLNNLKFDGFLTSDVFGVFGNPTCNITIPRKTFVVFYDPNAPIYQIVLDVIVRSLGITWCGEAMYIPCDHDIATSGCGNCTWNTSMVRYILFSNMILLIPSPSYFRSSFNIAFAIYSKIQIIAQNKYTDKR